MSERRLTASVIIPAYQQAGNLRQCLSALSRQTYKKFQVIVCDDGSSDDTKEVCQAFAGRLDLCYIYQPRRGPRRATIRNLALPHAKGDVVIFIDADIMCPSGFIKAHVNAHKRNMKSARTSKLLILGGRENVDLEEGRVHKDYRLSGEWARGDRKIWEFMGGSNFSIMREDLRKVGEFDRNYDGAWGYEDTDLAYRALEEGVKIEFLPDILVYHMHHTPTGMAKQKRNREYFHKKFGLRDKG